MSSASSGGRPSASIATELPLVRTQHSLRGKPATEQRQRLPQRQPVAVEKRRIETRFRNLEGRINGVHRDRELADRIRLGERDQAERLHLESSRRSARCALSRNATSSPMIVTANSDGEGDADPQDDAGAKGAD